MNIGTHHLHGTSLDSPIANVIQGIADTLTTNLILHSTQAASPSLVPLASSPMSNNTIVHQQTEERTSIPPSFTPDTPPLSFPVSIPSNTIRANMRTPSNSSVIQSAHMPSGQISLSSNSATAFSVAAQQEAFTSDPDRTENDPAVVGVYGNSQNHIVPTPIEAPVHPLQLTMSASEEENKVSSGSPDGIHGSLSETTDKVEA
ncbi:hypothetical protein B0F90DRAFT_1747563 [Multifurca ochricompacta]|uniref:Uncharacterized protein n=1 Tax=Multifurca ochricompacta TaxID=376703 RepID=A0AAD4LZT6_9AGAM|nr:hypothetical protein B0F90DRAFT_1747563 [Multifurca ochricompacta]